MDLCSLRKIDLTAYEGKKIGDICETGFDDSKLNHCAHFVSHALDIKTGMLCGSMKYETRGRGASVRVDSVFNYCIDRGNWVDRDKTRKACLIFTTPTSNVASVGIALPTMGDHPKRHIGIYFDGFVWHYSNSQDKVISEATADFENRFLKNYGPNAALYYGYRQDI